MPFWLVPSTGMASCTVFITLPLMLDDEVIWWNGDPTTMLLPSKEVAMLRR